MDQADIVLMKLEHLQVPVASENPLIILMKTSNQIEEALSVQFKEMNIREQYERKLKQTLDLPDGC